MLLCSNVQEMQQERSSHRPVPQPRYMWQLWEEWALHEQMPSSKEIPKKQQQQQQQQAETQQSQQQQQQTDQERCGMFSMW